MKSIFLLALVAVGLQSALAKSYGKDNRAYRRSGEVDMGPVDDYEVSDTKSVIHNNDQFKKLSPEERRKLATEFYYSAIGLCEKKSIENCEPANVKFVAKALAKGDPECFFYCGFDKMKENADKLPNRDILALAIDLGLDWTKEVKEVSDMEELDNQGREKEGAVAKDGKKRVFILPVVFAAIGALINVGSMAAVGYFSNDRNIDDMSKVGSKAGAIRAALTPALKVSRAAGCFDVKGIVHVQDIQGNRYSKKVGDLKIGDNVESVSDNGEIVYSNVYYIAHSREEKKANLLRVYYEETDDGKGKSIGLSERHLIYASKAYDNLNAVDAKPIMASKLNKGDFLWVHEDNKLVPKKVTEVLPYFGQVIHPLTDNHHIIVDGVHASVHIINESAYRMMTAPLKWVCWMSPQAAESKLVNKLVRFVENVKEPFASEALSNVFDGREAHIGIYGNSEA